MKRKNKSIPVFDFSNTVPEDGHWVTDIGNRLTKIGSLFNKFSELAKINDKSASVILGMIRDEVNESIAKDQEFIISDSLQSWRTDYLKLLDHILSCVNYSLSFNLLKAKRELKKANHYLDIFEVRLNAFNNFIR